MRIRQFSQCSLAWQNTWLVICVKALTKYDAFILRGSRHFTPVFKIAMIVSFKMDLIPVITFDISSISVTKVIYDIFAVSSASTFHEKGHTVCNRTIHVFIEFGFSGFEMMPSHNCVWLLSCINCSLTTKADTEFRALIHVTLFNYILFKCAQFCKHCTLTRPCTLQTIVSNKCSSGYISGNKKAWSLKHRE